MNTDRSSRLSNHANVINFTNNISKIGDILGGSNREVWHRFSIGSRSSVNISLNLLKTNVNFQLLGRDRRVLQTAAKRGNTSEALTTDLNAGTYFLRVYTKSPKFTRYRLELALNEAKKNLSPGDAADWEQWNSDNLGSNTSSDTGSDTSRDTGSDTSSDTSNIWGDGIWDVGDDSTVDDSGSYGSVEEFDTPNEPIIAPSTNSAIPATVMVTSPNGNEVLTVGNTYTITWTSHNTNFLKIDLFKGETQVRTIGGVTNIGSYRWTVPEDLVPGVDYRVQISSAINSTIVDGSDAFFSIH